MPLITLEYTKNIKHHPEFAKTFQHLHELVVSTLEAKLASCKSWAVKLDDYYIADGSEPKRAFVQVTIAILTGRDLAKRERLSQTCLEYLQAIYPSAEQKIDIAVEIREIERATYSQN